MIRAVIELRSQGLNVDLIAEKVGVNKDTFLQFRRRTGFRLAPIQRSPRDLVGRHADCA